MPTVENHESSRPQLVGYGHVYAEFQFQEFGVRLLIKRVPSVTERVHLLTEQVRLLTEQERCGSNGSIRDRFEYMAGKCGALQQPQASVKACIS